MVVPIAFESSDVLTVLRRRGDGFARTALGPCRFVPLIGEGGF
jgi:protein-L-isoaspartate O-methyltransferase